MIGYKYRANIVDENKSFRDIESLLKDELWASSLTNLNDPFEAIYDDNISKALEIFKQLFKAKTDIVQKNWNDLIDFKNKIGIYSLASSSKNYPDNELMWTHYANSHKGFCIAYDIEKLEDSETYLNDVNRMVVNYKKSPPIIDVRDILGKDFLVKMFGTKSKIWSYENEIRLIYSNFGIKKYNPFSLKSIYFGLKMEDEYQKRIIDGLTNRDVKFYKMCKQENSYHLKTAFICANERNIVDKLSPSIYEILKTSHNHTVENFHVLYKGKELDENVLRSFVSKFREQYATKSANIYIYNSKDIVSIIDKYPLYGKELALMEEHLIAESFFNTDDEVFMYSDK